MYDFLETRSNCHGEKIMNNNTGKSARVRAVCKKICNPNFNDVIWDESSKSSKWSNTDIATIRQFIHDLFGALKPNLTAREKLLLWGAALRFNQQLYYASVTILQEFCKCPIDPEISKNLDDQATSGCSGGASKTSEEDSFDKLADDFARKYETSVDEMDADALEHWLNKYTGNA